MFRHGMVLVLILSLTLTGFSQNKNSWMFGTWEGKGYQTDSDTTWTVGFKIQGNKYVIDYPSLKCGGEWNLISINSKEAKFRERINYGLEECTNNSLVVAQRLSNRQILILYRNKGSDEVIASVVLNRKLREGR
jgi:hypothetical protein